MPGNEQLQISPPPNDGATLKMRCRFAVDKTKEKTFMSGEAG